MFVIVVSKKQPRPGTHCARQYHKQGAVCSIEFTIQKLKTDKGLEKECDDFYPQ